MKDNLMFQETKKFYDQAYTEGHWSNYGNIDILAGRGGELAARTHSWLASTGLAKRPDATVLEIGCGMAQLSSIHPGWVGAEYSVAAVERVKDLQGHETPIFEADAQALPWGDQAFDGIFTWAALEHVPNPDLALREIDRVLRGGGML